MAFFMRQGASTTFPNISFMLENNRFNKLAAFASGFSIKTGVYDKSLREFHAKKTDTNIKSSRKAHSANASPLRLWTANNDTSVISSREFVARLCLKEFSRVLRHFTTHFGVKWRKLLTQEFDHLSASLKFQKEIVKVFSMSDQRSKKPFFGASQSASH